MEEFKLQARLHGAKFEEAEPSSASRQNPTHLPSPAEIKDMSPEERDRVTEQLMGRMASMGVAVKG